MNQATIIHGTKQVVATRNNEAGKWNARLYVNGGETATLVAKTFKTLAGVEKWAAKVTA
jgi:hypothetical protein